MNDEQRRQVRRILSGQEDEPVELETNAMEVDETMSEPQPQPQQNAEVSADRVLAYVGELDPKTLQLAVAYARIEQLEAQVRHASTKGETQED